MSPHSLFNMAKMFNYLFIISVANFDHLSHVFLQTNEASLPDVRTGHKTKSNHVQELFATKNLILTAYVIALFCVAPMAEIHLLRRKSCTGGGAWAQSPRLPHGQFWVLPCGMMGITYPDHTWPTTAPLRLPLFYSSLSCVIATQKKQLELHPFASSCFSFIACQSAQQLLS